MALISWNYSLSVKIEEFDQHHRKLISMINELSDAMIKRKGNDVLGKILNELIDYTEVHFKTEEDYFDRFNYPGSDAHKKEHAEFVQKVKVIKNRFDGGESLVTMDVLKLLSYWLQNHIKGTDKKYTVFLRGKGLR